MYFPGIQDLNWVTMSLRGLPWWLSGKELAGNAGNMGSIPGWGRSPARGHGNPLQYSCLENPHGQRSLADYSPWGHKESDTTERRIHSLSPPHSLLFEPQHQLLLLLRAGGLKGSQEA